MVRVGVLGAGRIGRMHAELLARQVPGATVATVFDPDAHAAREVGDWLDVATPASVDEVIESSNVDAVAICTPTGLHAEQVIAAAGAGKAIFCEKPVSLELAEVDRPLSDVVAAGVPFQIGFNQRFDPGHAAVAAARANGDVGEPHLVRISSRDVAPPPLAYARGSGGIFLDMTIHDFDMARFVAASENQPIHAAVVIDRSGAYGATLTYPFVDRYAKSYLAEWMEFIAAVTDGRTPALGVEDARLPLVIGLAAWHSIRERRPVRIEEISAHESPPQRA